MLTLLTRIAIPALLLFQTACVSTNTLEGRLEEGATFYVSFTMPDVEVQQSEDYVEQLEEELMGLFDVTKIKSISKPGSISIELTYRSPESLQKSQERTEEIVAKFEAENPELSRES